MDRNTNEDKLAAESEQDLFWENEYPRYDNSEKRQYWLRMFYWSFKNSYKEYHIDHFTSATLDYMKIKDGKFHEIKDDVIQDFINFIDGDQETIIELRKRLKLND